MPEVRKERQNVDVKCVTQMKHGEGEVGMWEGSGGKMIRGRCRWEGGKERQNVDAKCVKQMKDGRRGGGKVGRRWEDGKKGR